MNKSHLKTHAWAYVFISSTIYYYAYEDDTYGNACVVVYVYGMVYSFTQKCKEHVETCAFEYELHLASLVL